MIPDTSQIYFPAEDTHLLIRAALAEVKESDRVLEVGTGSGAVAKAVMTIAKKTAATEINPHAAAYAAAEGVAVVRGNLLDPIRGEFDLILFNAPYLPTTPEERMNDWLEFALDGGETGRKVIEWFLPAAIDHQLNGFCLQQSIISHCLAEYCCWFPQQQGFRNFFLCVNSTG